LIKKSATKGSEARKPILLQGHTDMVCEKNAGVEHDFLHDPIKLYEEDGWIKAQGTTLGADNGVAVAVMLYILDSGASDHPDIECLFTASEEVGLDGASNFDYSKIKARRMINMDSADETLIIAGCAGGQRSRISFEVKPTVIKANVAKIRISGLFGGHSGEDIDKGRANACKLMGRVLYDIMDKETELVSVCGGTKDNAIVRECEALVTVFDEKILKGKIEKLSCELREGLCKDDCGFALELDMLGEREVACIDKDTARKIVFLMHTVRNGVFEMNHDIEGLVEWSRNLGIVNCSENGAELVFSSRSSFGSRIDASADELDDHASFLGAKIKHYNRYPGWCFAPMSDIRNAYVSAFESLFGKKPEVTVIHAGLECGVISQALPDMDIISCGPVVLDLHSPDEKMNKKSFENFYTVIKTVVEKY
jgi:dipeptidase D